MKYFNHRILLVTILALYGALFVSSYQNFITPKGPYSVPFLGSLDFLFKLALKTSLPTIMIDYKNKYDPIIQLKTGPITQYWITDAEDILAEDLYNKEECSGRSQLKEPAFGGEFLFLTRDVQKARGIRKKQRDWLRTRASTKRITQSIDTVFPFIDQSFDITLLSSSKINNDKSKVWNQEMIGKYGVRALLGTFIGGGKLSLSSSSRDSDDNNINKNQNDKLDDNHQDSNDNKYLEGWLTNEELDILIDSTACYRKRAGKKIGDKLSYAEKISEIIKIALSRCSEMQSDIERNDALPLLVSGIVGGSEIYPLLLYWAARHLAITPGLQEALREECLNLTATSTSTSTSEIKYGSLMQKTITYLAWAHPYSAALGPPRKLTEDVYINMKEYPSFFTNYKNSYDNIDQEVMLKLEKEAIMFIIHPGLFLDWNQKIHSYIDKHNNNKNTKDKDIQQLTIKDVLPYRSDKQECINEILNSKSYTWPMFGMGERSCISPEMSICFLSTILSNILMKYKIQIASKYQNVSINDLFDYKEDGSLLVPVRDDIIIELIPI